MRAGKKSNDEGENSFNRGGKGRDSCSPKICVEILVVADEGFLVVPSVALVVEFRPSARPSISPMIVGTCLTHM